MLAIDYSTREFFNTLITVQWEWLLATIILTGKLIKSRLARTAQPATRNTKLCILKNTIFILLESAVSE